ncbi:ParA family protein [Neobacillus soli]|uniref:ParA family protein n=1 Tax=Neobacillus soli TaxID=220688 RepID=UPI000824CBF7|nr:ParA family protein [Neobacillus soli]
MGKSITILSTKGGVGKSTLTRYLAMSLNNLGFSTCIIDLCQNSSIATGFLQNRNSFQKTAFDYLTGTAQPSEVLHQFNETEIYYIPSNETIDDFEKWAVKNISPAKRLNCIASKTKVLKNKFDFVLFDTHPSENSDIVGYAIAASDFCLIPMEIHVDSKEAAKRSAEIVEEFKEDFHVDYAIVPNKVSTRNGKIIRQLNEIKQEFILSGFEESNFFSPIRFSDVVSTSLNEGKLLSEMDNKYAKETMNDFKRVTEELIAKLDQLH